MKLTSTLIGFLYRRFRKDPVPVLMLQLDYAGEMTWTVADQVLTTTVTGGVGTALSIDLTQYSLGSLATYLSGQPGYEVSFLDLTRANLSATVLLDASGDISQTGGDQLFGFTRLSWAWMDSVAAELDLLETQVANAAAQMSTTTASDQWLDLLGGGYYGVPRLPNETDDIYGPRIPATILQPKGNNVAIALVLQTTLGLANVQVTDVTVLGPVFPLFNGEIEFNGAYDYNAEPTVGYGLFDISADFYDGAVNGLLMELVITVVVNALRASGTHLRNISIDTDLTTIEGDDILTSTGDVISVSLF